MTPIVAAPAWARPQIHWVLGLPAGPVWQGQRYYPLSAPLGGRLGLWLDLGPDGPRVQDAHLYRHEADHLGARPYERLLAQLPAEAIRFALRRPDEPPLEYCRVEYTVPVMRPGLCLYEQLDPPIGAIAVHVDGPPAAPCVRWAQICYTGLRAEGWYRLPLAAIHVEVAE